MYVDIWVSRLSVKIPHKKSYFSLGLFPTNSRFFSFFRTGEKLPCIFDRNLVVQVILVLGVGH